MVKVRIGEGEADPRSVHRGTSTLTHVLQSRQTCKSLDRFPLGMASGVYSSSRATRNIAANVTLY